MNLLKSVINLSFSDGDNGRGEYHSPVVRYKFYVFGRILSAPTHEMLFLAEGGDKMAEKAEKRFNELYKIYSKRVFAYFYSYFHYRSTAEDLTQEVFLKIWRFLLQSRQLSFQCTDAWVFKVVINVRNDFLRKKQRSPSESSEEEAQEMSVADFSIDAVQSISIREAFETLNEAEKAVLRYRFKGISSSKASEITGIPASTLRSRGNTAKEHFRKSLLEQGIDPEMWLKDE